MRSCLSTLSKRLVLLLGLALSLAVPMTMADSDTSGLPPSNRVDINLGETPWRYLKDADPSNASSILFDDSSWTTVGIPQSASDNDTFINLESGGGQGQLTGSTNWYRKHFTLDSSYSNRKIFVEFEGANIGAQVYINGVFIPGNSEVNPNATHVVGFTPFLVDITNYVKFDGSDNVLAVKVSLNDKFFEAPSFAGAYRFGQSDPGLFRPVHMFITDKVHIPYNVYSVLNTWGTYVTTLSANDSSAVIEVQTNVLNENTTDQPVTLTTEIVDASGNVVATAQDTQTVSANVLPGLHPVTFDQTLTVNNPTLWYPNNSIYGKPYMYRVYHLVSVSGTVVDATQTPLGIRTITWDQNFPIINGHPHYLWGASGRYDYPALGSAVPEEQMWRDLSLLADAGGSLYRPGHSSQSKEFLDAADAYGIMMVQPSGDGENGFAIICSDTVTANCTTQNNVELKKELHRDMIVHDRNHPSVLAWEADNGATDTQFAQSLKALSEEWEPILTRAQSDRTPNPANGDILGCSQQGCDILTKSEYPNSPAWGSEYWGVGSARDAYDYELAYAAPYLKDWVHSVAAKSFGIAHWYLADTPGETGLQVDGTQDKLVRGIADSMMDANRIPKMLYYIYEAAWTPYQVKPVVKLAHHWNRSGDVRVNAFSNCPKVRLLLNGQQIGADESPNPPTSDPSADLSQNTTLLPGQVHWDVTWQPGTLKAECLDENGQVAASDTLVTSGAADHILLTVQPELKKPDGESFEVKANGSDAAFIIATVVDANNNRVPDATPVITFSVSGPGTYRGGTQYAVTPDQPLGYHAPGDPNLAAEGGMAKVAVKAQFTPGTVTVTATSPGLGSGTVSFDVSAVTGAGRLSGNELQIDAQQNNALEIVTQPIDQTVTIGQTAQFTVLTSGATPLAFQWMKNGSPIQGANNYTYTTPATVADDNGTTYSVQVSNLSGGNVTSNSAVLTVVAPSVPTITTQPADQSVPSGQSAQFSVAAAGSPVLSYQWFKNGVQIQGATNAVYNTPGMQSADSGSLFHVIVTNSAGSVTSQDAKLTVGAPVPPTIISQPLNQSITVGQSTSFSVVANGSAPLHYQWYNGQTAVGQDSSTYSIASAQSKDAGIYTVKVTNEAGSVTSNPASLEVSGNSGSNLALGKTATASSVQNDGLAAKYAIDDDTTTRWSSAAETDPSWIRIDLGSVQTFDQVILVWENAYATAYQIQVSSDDQNWDTVYTQNAGKGGTETLTFPTTSARYVRMYGTQRATQYGYSLYEFGVYNVPQCGANERYTVLGAASGEYTSTIPGIPSGPFVPTVKDNVSQLTWQQYVTTFSDQGAQFTQTIAEQYCDSLGMRLPTQAEALTISGTNYASCAFPSTWGTWTTTPVPNSSTNAYIVFSNGKSVSAIINNTPGWALCVQGDSAAAPVITSQPANQSVTEGQSATFTVTATGRGPLSYQWIENGNPVATTTTPSYTTQATALADNGGVFSVVISNGGGSVTSSTATLTVNAAASGGTGTGGDTGTGTGSGSGTDNQGTGNTGGGTGTSGGSTASDPSANLAIGTTATASGSQSQDNSAAAAIDGSLNTRWIANADDQAWITLDFGTSRAFDRVVLRWEAAYAKAYQIQVSDDNQNWTTVYTQTAGAGGNEDIRFTSTTSRYVRMQGNQRGTAYGYSLFEFEVYDTANTPQYKITASASANGTISPNGDTLVYQGGSQSYVLNPASGYAVTDVTVDGQSVGLQQSYTFTNVHAAHSIAVTFGPATASVNLALGKDTMSSDLESSGYPASNAVDGNTSTRWSSSFADPSWMTVDLGSPQTFNRVILRWENAYAAAYQIQVSNDNQNWTTVYTQNAGQGGVEDFMFTTTTARYVRFYGTQRATGYGYSLWEFEVYNMPLAPVLTSQLTDQTVNIGDTAQFSVSATGTAPLSYQWLKNGVPVETTTVSTYTTPATTFNDNGDIYSVVVSNSVGSVTSSTATLTVNGAASSVTNTNLALNMPAAASSVQDAGYPASNAFDGNQGSRWSSAFDDASWIAVDLGTDQAINRVILRWENAYGLAYQIQTSLDNQNWTTVYTQNAGTGGTEDITFSRTTARYVRMYGIKRATQYGYSLYEFEVYNTQNTKQFTITATAGANGTMTPSGNVSVYQGSNPSFTFTPDTGYAVTDVVVDGQDIGLKNSYTFSNVQSAHTISVSYGLASAAVNLALGKTATTSGTEGDHYAAANAFDGHLDSRWSSAFVDPSWIAVDLGSVQTFNRIILNWENAHAIAYQIQVSNDNQNWTTVYTQGASQGGVEDFTFPSTSARYVRLYGTQRSTQYGYSLWEFAIYNTNSTAVSALPTISSQPESQTVSLGQSAAFAVTATGQTALSYQWQKNGEAIPGATDYAYNTPITVASDNNAVFSVVVTDTAGNSVTSTGAVLTVGPTITYAVKPGFITIDLKNNTKGAFSDDQVYVAVIARDPVTQQFSWLKPDGTMVPAAIADNDASNHLSKNGQNYSNYFFTLADSKELDIPKMDSGRIFVSLGGPMYIKILADANNNIGFAGPNVLNPTDPNIDVNFDWYEFTYNNIGLWINTTQVDQFGFPLLLDVYGSGNTFHQETGINQSRAALFNSYLTETPAEFHVNALPGQRILAPTNDTFGVGQINGNYFDDYIHQVWSYYTTHTLTISMNGRQFNGTVHADNTFVFTEVDLGNGAYVGGTYTIAGMPTTQDVFNGTGVLATGNAVELAIEAQVCAAFNRHIMEDSSKWATPSAWYSAAPANFYAKYWHDHGVSGLAYGFPYDDVSDQSSTIIATQPEHMVFSIGW